MWYEEKFVAVLGLDGSGKTAFVNRVLYGDIVDTMPTMGFNIQQVTVGNKNIQLADVCGQDRMRPLWSNFYHSANGVIFIIDGTDRDRLPLALDELEHVMSYPGVENSPFLVLSNKQDLTASAVKVKEFKTKLKHTCWRSYDVSVKTGDGIVEAMLWFTSNI